MQVGSEGPGEPVRLHVLGDPPRYGRRLPSIDWRDHALLYILGKARWEALLEWMAEVGNQICRVIWTTGRLGDQKDGLEPKQVSADEAREWTIAHASDHVLILKECVFGFVVRAMVNNDERVTLGKIPGMEGRIEATQLLQMAIDAFRELDTPVDALLEYQDEFGLPGLGELLSMKAKKPPRKGPSRGEQAIRFEAAICFGRRLSPVVGEVRLDRELRPECDIDHPEWILVHDFLPRGDAFAAIAKLFNLLKIRSERSGTWNAKAVDERARTYLNRRSTVGSPGSRQRRRERRPRVRAQGGSRSRE